MTDPVLSGDRANGSHNEAADDSNIFLNPSDSKSDMDVNSCFVKRVNISESSAENGVDDCFLSTKGIYTSGLSGRSVASGHGGFT